MRTAAAAARVILVHARKDADRACDRGGERREQRRGARRRWRGRWMDGNAVDEDTP